MNAVVFFGAGRIGRTALQFTRHFDFIPDYFCDNAMDVQGTTIDGVEVLSIQGLPRALKEYDFYITCKQADSIISQLLLLGIEKAQIHLFNHHIQWLTAGLERKKPEDPGMLESLGQSDMVFELSNGLALGGVETWVISEAGHLKKMGYVPAVLVEKGKNEQQCIRKDFLRQISFRNGMTDYEKIEWICRAYIAMNPKVIVCNFAGLYAAAAFWYKSIKGAQCRIIAVIHNDIPGYFFTFFTARDYIDQCLVISTSIRDKLIETGFPEDKIEMLPWRIRSMEKWDREYSQEGDPLKIGYAGRITLRQKRSDLLLKLAIILKERGIRFVMSVAGTGDYYEELKSEIERNGMTEYVKLLGMLPNEEIPDFWLKQDIAISCSEYEGHSITQCEAMGMGVIPVLTDVSGVRDDVNHGRNGFVIPFGDLEGMADQIGYLEQHRSRLNDLGRQAYLTIHEKYREENMDNLWKKLLG